MSKKVKYAVIQLNTFFKKPRVDGVDGSFKEATYWAKLGNRQLDVEHYVLRRESGFEDADVNKTISLRFGDKVYRSVDHDDPCFRICGHFDTIRDDFESELCAERGTDNLGDFELVDYK